MASFDVIFVLPYPFSDHPSFPEGILRKALEVEGYRVGIIETPFWQEKESFRALGWGNRNPQYSQARLDALQEMMQLAKSAGDILRQQEVQNYLVLEHLESGELVRIQAGNRRTAKAGK